jgi:hypothetical protein
VLFPTKCKFAHFHILLTSSNPKQSTQPLSKHFPTPSGDAQAQLTVRWIELFALQPLGSYISSMYDTVRTVQKSLTLHSLCLGEPHQPNNLALLCPPIHLFRGLPPIPLLQASIKLRTQAKTEFTNCRWVPTAYSPSPHFPAFSPQSNQYLVPEHTCVCKYVWLCACVQTHTHTHLCQFLNVFPRGCVNVYGHRSFCVSMCTYLWINLWFFTGYHFGPKIWVYSCFMFDMLERKGLVGE